MYSTRYGLGHGRGCLEWQRQRSSLVKSGPDGARAIKVACDSGSLSRAREGSAEKGASKFLKGDLSIALGTRRKVAPFVCSHKSPSPSTWRPLYGNRVAPQGTEPAATSPLGTLGRVTLQTYLVKPIETYKGSVQIIATFMDVRPVNDSNAALVTAIGMPRITNVPPPPHSM